MVLDNFNFSQYSDKMNLQNYQLKTIIKKFFC